MRYRALLTYSLLVLAPLALFWGCSKGAPSAPVLGSKVSVTVPLTNARGQIVSSVPVTVLYYFSAGSGAPVTGVAGTVAASTGSSFSFDKSLPSGTSYNYVAIQMTDYSGQVVALGAASITGSTAPVTLGPVNRAPYQVTLGAGQGYGFESNSKPNVGTMPTPTPGWGLDVLCNTTSTGFELDGLTGSTIAYLGNGIFYNYLKVPAASAFQTSTTVAKSLATTSTDDVAPGDIFCVKLNAGGYAWLQAETVSGSGIYFQYRVNTTLPYCGYEQTTADLTVFNSGNPTATATAVTAPVTIAGSVTISGVMPYDVAVLGPANSAATSIFVSDSSSGYICLLNSSLSMSASFTGTGVVSSIGLAINPAGTYLYAADPSGWMVNQFDLGSSPITWTGCIGNGTTIIGADNSTQAGNGALLKPRYVSFDNSGNLFITDAGTTGFADVMEYFGPTIPLTATTNVNYWTGSLSSSVAANCVGQIANAGTTAVIADSANNRIGLYAASETAGFAGAPLLSLTSDNNPGGSVAFSNPQGVAYSASTGYLYISDTGNNRIVEMTLTGSFVKILNNTTLGAGTLNSPTGIKLDGAQPPFIYIANTGNSNILKLQ